LDKAPERRYQSTAALGKDLEQLLDHQPIHARPRPPRTRRCDWPGLHASARASFERVADTTART
ncbi:MAG: hypothetical protein AAGK04_09645, partial [Planctomycetota bacterium]